jgi:TM2 domain-containing membrane protein YozV
MSNPQNSSPLILLVLSVIPGAFGLPIPQFMAGKTGKAIAMLLLAIVGAVLFYSVAEGIGGLMLLVWFVMWISDTIRIAIGRFENADGQKYSWSGSK